MLSQNEIIEVFHETKALREGHFRYTSGKHSKQYLQCSLLLQYPNFIEKLCEDLARRFKGQDVHTVLSPGIAGIILGFEVAKILGVRSLFTEREDGKMTFRRGYKLESDENVLIIEDVITSGGSIVEVINLVKEQEANIIGVGVLVDRSGGKVHLGLKKEALLTLEIPTWDLEECPLCKENIPITK